MAKHEAGNGNNLKAAFEQAEKERREREIKAREKHLRENGENGETKQSPKASATETDVRVIPDEVKQKLGNDISDENLRLYNRLPEERKEGLLAKLVSRKKEAEERTQGRQRGKGSRKGRPRRPADKIREPVAPEKQETGAEVSSAASHLAVQNRPKPRIRIKSTPEQIRVISPDELAPLDQPELTATEVVPEPVSPLQKESADVEFIELEKAKKDLQDAMEELKSAVRSGETPSNADRIREIRERLAILDREAANPADYLRKHDEIENEVLALEKELKDLELAGRPVVEKPPVDEPVVTTPTAETVESPITVDKEATSGEGRNMLRSLVEKLTKVTGAAKEKFDWYKSSKEGLIRRNAELDTQLETIGGKLRIERSFRWIGEKYNKMPLKYKLALGATLGLGTVLSAGTLAVAFPLLGIAAQRSAGLATMYMKFEKKSHDEKWGKNVEWGKQKAMLKAGIYTVLLGLTMKEAIEYASGTDLAHAAQAKVEGFLGWMMGHTALQPVASVPERPTPLAQPPAPEVQVAEPPSAPVAEPAEPASPSPQLAAAAAAVAAAESSATIPEVSVEATRGKGYEYMAKRLWEQLQDKNLDAGQYVDGSDARRLLEADPSSINKVVHDIAAERGIYKPDGTSIQINLGDKLSFDAQGNLKVSNGQTFVNAPEGAPVTPLYPPEPVQVRPPPQELRDFLDKRFAPEEIVPAETQSPAVDIPSPEEAPAEPLPNVKVPEPERYATVDMTQEQASAGALTEATTPAPEVITNSFGLKIQTAEPHIYAGADAGHTFVFGGTPTERANAILQYLRENPNKVVFGPDDTNTYRIPWHLVEGKLTAGSPMRTRGLFGFLSTWMKPPGPEDLEKIIK